MKNDNKIIFEIDEKGNQTWRLNGLLNREDGPAMISSNGTEQWFIKDKLHREGDEPAVIFKNGNKAWYKNGLLHREDNPAIIMNNGEIQEWFFHGKQHRIDGPALINQTKQEWWIDGIEKTKAEFTMLTLVRELSNELPNTDLEQKKLKL